MKEFEKLLESGLLDEETTSSLKEALDKKVLERLEKEKEKLREEYAQRYQHDKKVMIEAADKMFNDNFEKELTELREEKNSLIEEKIKYKRMMKESAKAVQTFATDKLLEEIKELRSDRRGLAEALKIFERFASKKLNEELTEFHEDKRDLVETKVKLIKDAKRKIDETKKEFVRRASQVAESKIESVMRKEITDFRKDIEESRKNHFGRRIFEAFQSEFITSHTSDSTKLKEMSNGLRERDNKLAEAEKIIKEHEELIEAANAKARIAENRLVRTKKMTELLAPLPKDKKELMSELLDKVPTNKLDESYKKHIKYVLGESKQSAKVLSEGKKSKLSSNDGNKRQLKESEDFESTINIEDERLKRLAGLNN